MSWIISLASIIMFVYMALTLHPFENETVNIIIFPLLTIIYVILLCISDAREEKINKRIEMLEKKLSDKEKEGKQK